jgi:hypothetical protein
MFPWMKLLHDIFLELEEEGNAQVLSSEAEGNEVFICG